VCHSEMFATGQWRRSGPNGKRASVFPVIFQSFKFLYQFLHNSLAG
jgi:hypothetical protein